MPRESFFPRFSSFLFVVSEKDEEVPVGLPVLGT
jgi:hypothetical protein